MILHENHGLRPVDLSFKCPDLERISFFRSLEVRSGVVLSAVFSISGVGLGALLNTVWLNALIKVNSNPHCFCEARPRNPLARLSGSAAIGRVTQICILEVKHLLLVSV